MNGVDHNIEIWKIIHYEHMHLMKKVRVSSHGAIEKYDPKRNKWCTIKCFMHYGKPYIDLPITTSKIKRKTIAVRRLIAQTFIKNNGKKYVINLDYNVTNNKVTNLKWVNTKERNVYLKKSPFGYAYSKTEPFNKKINMTIAKRIRKEVKDCGTLRAIGDKYGISRTQVARIRDYRCWK